MLILGEDVITTRWDLRRAPQTTVGLSKSLSNQTLAIGGVPSNDEDIFLNSLLLLFLPAFGGTSIERKSNKKFKAIQLARRSLCEGGCASIFQVYLSAGRIADCNSRCCVSIHRFDHSTACYAAQREALVFCA